MLLSPLSLAWWNTSPSPPSLQPISFWPGNTLSNGLLQGDRCEANFLGQSGLLAHVLKSLKYVHGSYVGFTCLSYEKFYELD
jgi:hypothetical protein